MSKSNKDNKLVDILIIVGIVFLIGSLVLMFSKGDNNKNNIVEINYDKYTNIIKEDKYNIILLTSPTCSHCVSYKPYVNAIAGENNLTVYNIDLNNLEYEEYVAIHDKYNATKNQYGEGNTPSIPTPVTIITKNGEEVTSTLGNIGEKGFRNLLKNYGIIK